MKKEILKKRVRARLYDSYLYPYESSSFMGFAQWRWSQPHLY